MQLHVYIGKINSKRGKMQFDYTSCKNDARCCNPSLELMTKAKACKGASQKLNLKITFHAPRSVKECEGMNPTLPSGFPLWELDSRWTPEFSKDDCKGQNSLD